MLIFIFFFFFWVGVGCVYVFFQTVSFMPWRLHVSGRGYLAVINKVLHVFLPPGDENRVHSTAVQEAQQS